MLNGMESFRILHSAFLIKHYMRIIILRSSFQTDDFVRNEYADLIQRLENECQAEINIIGDENVETHGRASLQTLPDAFMIATGGVENLFKRIWSAIDVEMTCAPNRPKTVTMIADGRNNSLANLVVCYRDSHIVTIPIDEALQMKKSLDPYMYRVAYDVSI